MKGDVFLHFSSRIPRKPTFKVTRRFLTFSFFTANDIFSATLQYVLKSEPEGVILARGREDICHLDENICSIPAGGESD